MIFLLQRKKGKSCLRRHEFFERYAGQLNLEATDYERFMAGEFTIENTRWVNPGDQEKEPIK
jgi:hypothetical protein